MKNHSFFYSAVVDIVPTHALELELSINNIHQLARFEWYL